MEATLQPKKQSLLRTVMRAAREELSRRGVCFTLTASLLLLLLFGMAFLMLGSVVAFFLDFFAASFDLAVLEPVYYALELIALLAVVMPALLGRMRLSGLIVSGQEPPLGEAFYYFSHPRHYLRSLLIGLGMLLSILVPVGVAFGMSTLSFALYRGFFSFELLDLAAKLCLAAMLVLTAALSGFLLLLSVLMMTAPALAVGCESLSLRRCARYALVAGFRHKRLVFGFLLRLLYHAFLSLVTLGLAHLFYYSHYNHLAYMRLSMALCPKGE